MASLEEKVKAKTLQIRLKNAFTFLEVLVVISIIALASSSFILLFQQPTNALSIKEKVHYYSTLSMYTGNVYKFSNDGVYKVNNDIDELVEENINFNVIGGSNYSGTPKPLENDLFYLTVFPGFELSSTHLVLGDGRLIKLTDDL